MTSSKLRGQPISVSLSMAFETSHGSAPLFRRIADTLADAIGRGDYPVGDRLPGEFALMRMFGASRFTIREALSELRARGLVASRRGSGTVVLRAAALEPTFGESYRSIDTFLAGVVAAPLETLSLADIVADRTLALELRCEEGRQFIALHGIRRRGRTAQAPLALVHAYVNATYGALRPHLNALKESIAGLAEKQLGVRVHRIEQELDVITLNPDEAAALAAPPGGAALQVRRWYYLDTGELLLTSRSLYPQGRLVHRSELLRA